MPPGQLSQFLDIVHKALRPGGRVFFVDSKCETASTARDNILPGEGSIVARRTLNDGRTFDIIKVFYDPGLLSADFGRRGFDASIRETARFFIHGGATKR